MAEHGEQRRHPRHQRRHRLPHRQGRPAGEHRPLPGRNRCRADQSVRQPALRRPHRIPRLYITAGDVESLYDDSVRLHALAEKCGVDVTFTVGEGQQHVFPFLAGRHERADQEIAAMAAWYAAGYEA
ncbi:hypothetical protein ACFSVJ_14195 [Prauserella oleivorans]